jgi:hypothetical protein
VSGKLNAAARPLMSAEQATQLLDRIVHERVRELVDLCALLDFEQELWHALAECGLSREEVPRISAQMIARAFAMIGEQHVELASSFDRGASAPAAPD